MKATRTSIIAGALLSVACRSSPVEISLLRPHFAALLQLPNLSGEVVITRDDGTEVARESVVIDGDSFSVSLPGLPSQVDLVATLSWSAGGFTIAHASKNIRFDAGETANVTTSPSDYVYPDDDGDGATNIFEVNYAASGPAAAAAAVTDPAIAPVGFFNGISGAISLPGVGVVADISSTSNLLLAPTAWPEPQGPNIIFSEQQTNVYNFTTRQRHSHPLELPTVPPLTCGADKINAVAIRPDFPREMVIACAKNLFFVVFQVDVVVNIIGIPFTSEPGDLLYSKSGERLYVRYGQMIGVVDVSQEPLRLIETLDSTSMWGEDLTLGGIADTGSRLLIADAEQNSLIVIDHTNDADFSFAGFAVRGELSEPGAIVLHPAGHRAYVANPIDGKVRAVDITAADPIDWSIVAEFEIGSQSNTLAIEPVFGNWLYATAPGTIVRIDTLDNTEGWRFNSESSELGGIFLSEDGTDAFVTSAEALILKLGFVAADRNEMEPNSSIAEATNVIGPPPAHAIGYALASDTGTLETIWDIQAQQPAYPDDLEDVWRLDVGEESGRLAIAVIPAINLAPVTIDLVDATGAVLEHAQWPGGTRFSTGSGAFMITELAPSLPPDVFVAVGVDDITPDTFTSYELVIAPLPATLPSVLEIEPNDTIATAQQINNRPVVVNGQIDVNDPVGIPLYSVIKDCFLITPRFSHTAVRIDGDDAGADLHLIIFDELDERMANTYAFAGEPGLVEYMLFEPYLLVDHVTVCVGIHPGQPATQTGYSLTMVDLDAR